jgi:hypothetical protein
MAFSGHCSSPTVMLQEIKFLVPLPWLVAMCILITMVETTVSDTPMKALVLVEWLAHKGEKL